MANPTGNNAEAGDVAKTAGIEVISRKSDATGCSKGDVVHLDTDGLTVKGTSSGTQAWGYGVALEAIAANADGRIAVGNTYVYAVAGEAIIPFNAVDIDATAGRVGSHDKPAVANTTTYTSTETDAAVTYFDKIVGRYIGHQLEEVGDPTDAADGDIVMIRLGL